MVGEEVVGTSWMGDKVINGGREAVNMGIKWKGDGVDGGHRYFVINTTEQVGFQEFWEGKL